MICRPVKWVRIKWNGEYQLRAKNNLGLVDILAAISGSNRKFYLRVADVNVFSGLFTTLQEAKIAAEEYYNIDYVTAEMKETIKQLKKERQKANED